MANRFRHIDHPSAWRPAEIGGREGVVHRLGREHIEACADLLKATRHLPFEQVRRGAYVSTALEELMANARDVVMNGRGLIVLSGLDISGMELEDYRRIYWFLGTHLGRPVAQSAKGDLVGQVQHVTESRARGYLSDMELGPHTDYHEVLSLASVRKATRGGLSGMTSTLAVHNEMLATRPDLLEALYEGYYNGIPARYGANQHEAGGRKVPIFSETDGKVSAFTLNFWRDAAVQRGEEIPAILTEALAYMREIARREDFQVRFMLEPGEMMFWHNWVVFHSRTRFENDPGDDRLLLRLWLSVPEGGRPVHPDVALSGELVAAFHEQGLDQKETAMA